MIIDVHTHIWTSLEQLGARQAERLRNKVTTQGGRAAAMSEVNGSLFDNATSCVDVAIVHGFQSERLEARIPNELVAEFVSRHPERRIGVAGVDPMTSVRCAEDQIEAARELGLVGVTLSPACQGFHPSHSSAMRVYELCASRSLPVFVTAISWLGNVPGAVLEFARPVLWDEVAQAFPELPIVIGRLGHPWIDETLALLGQHENVYADIAGLASRPWQLYNALLSAASLGVMDKLLFASGYPFESPAKAIEAIYSINSYSHGTHMPSVPRSLIQGIVERDSLACLGIEADVPTRRVTSVSHPARVSQHETEWLKRS
jgi:predicted TIM-barrel fold metal-dependent hydrolase